MQRAEATAEEYSWKRVGALSGFMPSVNVSAVHFLDRGYEYTPFPFQGKNLEVPGVFPMTQVTFAASLPIFDGFQNINNYSAARSRESAARHDFDWARFQFEQSVRLAFYQSLAADQLETVSEENVKTLKDHLEQILAVRRGGAATDFDVIRVRVQLREAESDRMAAKDNRAMAREHLNELLVHPGDTRILEGELPRPTLDRILGLSVPQSGERPDIAAVELRSDAQADLSRSAHRWWVPRVSLGYNYILYNEYTNGVFDSMRNAYQLGLFANWSLFDGMKSIAEAGQSEQRRVQEEAKTAEITQHLPVDFDNWKRRYATATSLYSAKLESVEQSVESVRLATNGYRAGVRTSTEVLDAELDLFRSRAGVVNAQIDAAQSLINLELALGRRI